MARMYFGKTLMSPHTVDEKEVAKTKFGVSIDDLLGDVDENGAYTPPSQEPSFVFDLTGVTSLPQDSSFEYFYYAGSTPVIGGQVANRMNLVGVVANDLVKITTANSFHGFATYVPSLKYVQFDGLEECYGLATFSDAFSEAAQASFKKLRIVKAQSAFSKTFHSQNMKFKMDMDAVFPSLEIIGGQSTFGGILYSTSTKRVELRFSKIHTVYGVDTTFPSYGTFSSLAAGYFDIYLPRCATIEYRVAHTNHVLHFAAANQSVIEACTGYDYKFGAKEIYFDLMLTITVDGVVYDREYTIAGYTSWKDANGNLVYTDATAEPAVGTVVYSDQGTTQAGTVEAVA